MLKKQTLEYALSLNESGEPSKYGGLVFVITKSTSKNYWLEHSEIKLNGIQRNRFTPVKGDGLVVEDLVYVLPHDTGMLAKVSRMEWDYQLEKIAYTLQTDAQKLKKQYFIEDLELTESFLSCQSNPELEIAIQENPENLAAWAVYADWLQSKQDSRGEMISLELALQKSPGNSLLRKRLNHLISPHQKMALRELQENAGYMSYRDLLLKLEWFGGFIRKAEFIINYEYTPTNNMLAMLLDLDISKFLYNLRALKVNKNGLKPLQQGPPLPSLRKLVLKGRSNVTIRARLSLIIRKAPNLKLLRIKYITGLSANINHESIKTLELDLNVNHLKYITQGWLPQVRILILKFDYKSPILAIHIKDLIETESLPRLKHLEISDFQSERSIIIENLFPSDMIARLEKLLVEVNNFNEQMANYLIENHRALEHLKKLKISYRLCPKNSIRRLKKCFGKRLILKKI